MRWLARLLHASALARYLLKSEVIAPRSVPSRPAHPPAIREAAGIKPLPDPKPLRKTDPRLTPLKLASNAKGRQEAASRHPELRPPHAQLSHRENQVLELAFWRGLVYKEVGEQLGISTARATQLSHRALRKLDNHLSVKGEPQYRPTPPTVKVDDPRITALRNVQVARARQEVAGLYPELRPPHALLQARENMLLELYYWQGLSHKQIVAQSGMTKNQVREVRHRALRKLSFYYQRTQARAGSSAQADATVAATPTPSPPLVMLEDPRITALRTAGLATTRREVAACHPELRPPHSSLSDLQNDLLELAYWQGLTYQELAERKDLSGRKISTSIRQALKQLDRHLHRASHQDEDSLGEVLLALNTCGSVKHAAEKLGLSADVLRAFMERAGIKARTVFEVEETPDTGKKARAVQAAF